MLREVEFDSQHYAIGAVLYQDGKPIAFESKKLDYAQCQYTVQKRIYLQLYMRSKHGAIIYMEIVL